jgi:hypothetical protein
LAVKVKEKTSLNLDDLIREPSGMSLWGSGGFFQDGLARPDVYARVPRYSGFDSNGSFI